MIPLSILAAIAALFGAVVGSFLNVVILRLPNEGESIAFPASHCPVCKTPLHWYENIPLFSYLFLLGKCGHCKTGISFQYPLVELVMAGLSFNVLRVGKSYKLVNFGDQYDFIIESVLANGDFKVKDVHTLERYLLKDLIKFGRGKDFNLEDLE